MQLARDEQARLLLHRLAQVLVEVGELVHIGNYAGETPELEPLVGEIVDERLRPRIAQHSADLPFEHDRVCQRATYGQVQQLLIRDAAPDKE